MTQTDPRIAELFPTAGENQMSHILAETSFRRALPAMPPSAASPVLAIGAVLSLILLASMPAGAGMKPLLSLALPAEAKTRVGAGAEAHSILSVCVLTPEAARVTPTCAAPSHSAADLGAVPKTE